MTTALRLLAAVAIAIATTFGALAAVVWMSTTRTAEQETHEKALVVYEIAPPIEPEAEDAIPEPLAPELVATAARPSAGPSPLPKQSALGEGPSGSITPSAIGLPMIGSGITGTIDVTPDVAAPTTAEPDVAAKPLVRPSPRYPRAAQRSGTEGHVVVRMRIDERGHVVDVAVVSATPPGVFDEVAMQTARTYRFSPARKGGKAVATTVQQRIVFRLDR